MLAKAVEASCWMAGRAHDYPEHLAAGLEVKEVQEKYYYARRPEITRVVDITKQIDGQLRGLITLNTEETLAVRDTYRRYLGFLAAQLPVNDALPSGDGPTPEEGICALLGGLTGFLSHYVLLAPLATLAPQRTRIETALTMACLAFWQSKEHG